MTATAAIAINTMVVVAIAFVAMHFKFIVRKVLVALGYPKFETVHPALGRYEVGAIRLRLSPDLPPCQLFYPVEPKGIAKTHTKNAKTTFVPYYRPQSVKGLVKFLHNGDTVDGLIQMLQDASHPLSDNYAADPLPAPAATKNNTKNNKNHNNNNDKFPLVLFSHGLGGSMEMYTELCSQLASLGCVVVAPEHADTSASYSSKVTADGTVEEIWYKPPLPDSIEPYSRQKMVDYRGPHLEDRVDELTALYCAVLTNTVTPTPLRSNVSANANANASAIDSEAEAVISLTNQILAAVDPLQLHLVGHSFGGATQLLAAQRWATERISINRQRHKGTNTNSKGSSNGTNSNNNNNNNNSSSSSNRTKTTSDPPIVPLSVTVLDAWNFALSDAILARGIPSVDNNNAGNNAGKNGPPILSILSEEWALTNPEREQLMVFLRNSRKSCKRIRIDSYYAMHSVHQSVSDTEAWLPTIASKAFENRGPLEKRHATIRAVTSAFARHSGMVIATPSSDAGAITGSAAGSVSTGGTLVPFPIESSSSSSSAPMD